MSAIGATVRVTSPGSAQCQMKANAPEALVEVEGVVVGVVDEEASAAGSAKSATNATGWATLPGTARKPRTAVIVATVQDTSLKIASKVSILEAEAN